MKQTILVTGGAGYIGSHTILELIDKTDFEIISIDNYSNSSAETFPRIAKISGRKIYNHPLDLCDRKGLFDFVSTLENVVGIIHFGSFML